MPKAPDDLDRPLAFMLLEIGGAGIGERHRIDPRCHTATRCTGKAGCGPRRTSRDLFLF